MIGKAVKVVALLALGLSLGGCMFFGGKQKPVDFWQPVLSPDGKYLAYVAKGEKSYELFIMDMETKEETQLTSDDFDEVYPSWSPDGKKLSFMAAQEKDNWDIFTIDIETHQIFRVTTDPAVDANPSWSETGEIIFNSNRGDRWAAYAIKPDGTGLHEISFQRPEEEESSSK